MPRVFDPFAGGGAIPLEASRLGCRSFGNDINPVAHIIQKGSLEFPQKYGKPIIYSRREFLKRYGADELRRIHAENPLYADGDRIKIENRLAFDVEFYAKELLKRAEAEIGHFYPADENGKKPIAYYWARVATCSNPSCRAEVPLLKGFYLVNKPDKKVYLKPIIDGNKIDFEISEGDCDEEGWVHSRKNLRCPVCLNNTSNSELKRQFLSNKISEKILAVIEDSDHGKAYRVPTEIEKRVVKDIVSSPNSIPEKLPVGNTKQFDLCPWGFVEYGQMFAPRQLLAMQTLVGKLNEIKHELFATTDVNSQLADAETQLTDEETHLSDEETQLTDARTQASDRKTQLSDQETQLSDTKTQLSDRETHVTDAETQPSDEKTHITDLKTLLSDAKTHITDSETHPTDDYAKAVITYLGILVDRVAMVNTSFGRWNVTGEKIEHPFSRQAIPMTFDYPESNLFCNSTGSAINQLQWIKRFFESESNFPFSTSLQNASSGEKTQFSEKSITAVITDPPYYDAIAYADLSDFFYVWLKRTLGDVYPVNFATPQTPKSDECTALKHHHENSRENATRHFETKLFQIFDAIEHQTSDIVSIIFAHQSTEAWTTLCNSILGAKMNITGSWAIDTEMANRTLALAGAALESSVTVSCKPVDRQEYGDYQAVKRAIERKVAEEVETLYGLGFRGSDLLTACFGKAVSVFGEYANVEKADGSSVSVEELLKMTRQSALNALVKNFDGDEFTKFYLAWLQMVGFVESDHNESLNFVRAGMSIEHRDLINADIFITNGNKESLARFDERNERNRRLGENANAPLIDRAHKAMSLYKKADRAELLKFLGATNAVADSPFWRVLTSLEELTKGTDDYKQIAGLLGNRENLIRDSQKMAEPPAPNPMLFE